MPNGQEVFDDAVVSQKHAVSTAIERLFIGSTIAGLIVVALALTMKEIPLRRTFSSVGPEGEGAPAFEPAAEPV